MLSRLVITFLPRSKRPLISWLQSPSAVILEPKKIKSASLMSSEKSADIAHQYHPWSPYLSLPLSAIFYTHFCPLPGRYHFLVNPLPFFTYHLQTLMISSKQEGTWGYPLCWDGRNTQVQRSKDRPPRSHHWFGAG